MIKTVEMPEVLECSISECAYNTGLMCHARAVTMGDDYDHLCDTMLTSKQHTQRKEGAGVGACRALICAHNDDFECQADGIAVSMSGGRALCGTFCEE
jgi:hypothetical protein